MSDGFLSTSDNFTNESDNVRDRRYFKACWTDKPNYFFNSLVGDAKLGSNVVYFSSLSLVSFSPQNFVEHYLTFCLASHSKIPSWLKYLEVKMKLKCLCGEILISVFISDPRVLRSQMPTGKHILPAQKIKLSQNNLVKNICYSHQHDFWQWTICI